MSINVRGALIGAAKDFLINNSSIDTDSGTIVNLPVLDTSCIAWENVNFDKANKETWAKVFYVPNQPTGRTIGDKGYNELSGFMQIDFNVTTGKGEETLINWEKKAEIYFHAGRSFSKNGQGVIITSSGMGQGRIIGNFYRKSLTVAFRCDIKRKKVI